MSMRTLLLVAAIGFGTVVYGNREGNPSVIAVTRRLLQKVAGSYNANRHTFSGDLS